MNRATPALRALAGRLLKHEASLTTTERKSGQTVFRVCESLRASLTPLAGAAGFHALLSRALVLAADEVRWLHTVHVAPNGSLDGLTDAGEKTPRSDIAEGEMVLIANLLALLTAFIGEGLTMQLLKDVWPHAVAGSPTKVPENDK